MKNQQKVNNMLVNLQKETRKKKQEKKTLINQIYQSFNHITKKHTK